MYVYVHVYVYVYVYVYSILTLSKVFACLVATFKWLQNPLGIDVQAIPYGFLTFGGGGACAL